MAVLEVPTSADPFFAQTSQLDGVDYGLVFVYNQRENCYYLSVEDVEGNPLVKGLKLVCSLPLLAPYKFEGLPPGELIVSSVEARDLSPPGLGELGVRCKLLYVTADDESLSNV